MKDFSNMMKQAQELQSRMQEMQAEIERIEREGTAGAGLVTVTLNGKGVMTGLRIDPSLLKEEADILEDLVTAAHNAAKQKIDAAVQEKAKSLTGGLPLPPGLKLF